VCEDRREHLLSSFLFPSSGLKQLNDWPTFPQIIVNGELIGGLDILKVRRRLGGWWQ
jgi:hypothetical protein